MESARQRKQLEIRNQLLDDKSRIVELLELSFNLIASKEVDDIFLIDLIGDYFEISSELGSVIDYLETKIPELKRMANNENLSFSHRQLVLLYCQVAKEIEFENSHILGRFSMLLNNILPENPRIITKKKEIFHHLPSKYAKIERYCEDCSVFFVFNAKEKKFELKNVKTFKDFLSQVDVVVGEFEKTKIDTRRYAVLEENEAEVEIWRRQINLSATVRANEAISEYQINSADFQLEMLLQILVIVNLVCNPPEKYLITFPKDDLLSIKSRIESQIKNISSKTGCEYLVLETDPTPETVAEEQEDGEFEEAPLREKSLCKFDMNRVFNQVSSEHFEREAEWYTILTSSKDFAKTFELNIKELDEQLDAEFQPLDDMEEEYMLYNDVSFNFITSRAALKNLNIVSRSTIDPLKPSLGFLEQWRSKSTEINFKRDFKDEDVEELKREGDAIDVDSKRQKLA